MAASDTTETAEPAATKGSELVEQGAAAAPHHPSSGVRPSPTALAARVEAAMTASARTAAVLSDLLRTAKFLTAAITTVRDAHTGVVRELEELCRMFEGDTGERFALERRIQRLERILEETTQEAVNDRDLLLSDHDAFIAMLVADHEHEIERLRERLAEVTHRDEAATQQARAAGTEKPGS